MKNFCAYVSKRLNPKKYWKKMGLYFGKNVRLLGDVDFGTEPYLISLGDDVVITHRVLFITHDGACNVINKLYDKNFDLIKRISVGNNVFIGSNSIILYGANIGDNVIVGANSVVTRNLDANGVYAGAPAKRICSVKDFYEKHFSEFLPTHNLCSKEKKIFLERYCLKEK